LNTCEDLDTIKLRLAVQYLDTIDPVHGPIGRGYDSTYMWLARGAIEDTSANPSVAIPSAAAQEVAEYTTDTTNPTLVAFNLDMTTGVLELSFDEAVDVSEIVITALTLQNEDSSADANHVYTLTDSSYSLTSEDGLNMQIQIGWSDLNEIKLKQGLANNGDGDTYLWYTADAIKDMFANAIVPRTSSYAKHVSDFKDDQFTPFLTGFQLDMDQGIRAELVLTFSEPVLGTSLDMRGIGITCQTCTNAHVPTPGEGTKLSNYDADHNGLTVTIRLGSDFVNEMKQDTAIATDEPTSTYITVKAGSLVDMQGKPVDAMTVVQYDTEREMQHPHGTTEVGTALPARIFLRDETAPHVTAAYIEKLADGNHKYRVTFDETVEISTVNYKLISLAADYKDAIDGSGEGNECAAGGCEYTLKDGTTITIEDGTTLTFSLVTEDDNNQKRKEVLLPDIEQTTFEFVNEFVFDMFGNPLLAHSEPVSEAALETRKPSLVQFRVDVNSSLLFLVFDEPVRANTMAIEKLTVQGVKTANSASSEVTLTSSSKTYSDNGLQIIVQMSLDDTNRIKQDTDLLADQSTSFVRLDAGFIEDMAQVPNPSNAVEASNAFECANYEFDVTAPKLDSFDIDMDLGRLTMHFKEVVSVLSVDVTQITFTNGPDETQTRTLTGGTTGTTQVTSLDHVRDFYIDLTKADMNNIKYKRIAEDKGTAWLTLTSETLHDANDQAIREEAFPVQATNYEFDITRPVLKSFDLSMTSNVIALTFVETVKPASFEPTSVTFYGGADAIQEYHVPSLNVDVGIDECNDLCGPEPAASCLVSCMSLARPDAQCELICNQGPVGEISSCARGCFLRPSASNEYTLTGDSYVLGSTNDDTVVYIMMSEEDMNEIKLRDGLAMNSVTTMLTIEGNGGHNALYGVKDMQNNEIATIINRVVTQFHGDITRPNLLNFELDLSKETLTLTFDETIFKTPNVTAITLVRSDEAGEIKHGSAVRLTSFYSVSQSLRESYAQAKRSDDGLILTITLDNDDVNLLKVDRKLTVSKETTYIKIEGPAFLDMNMNEVNDIKALSAQVSFGFTEDSVDPQLEHFDLNLTAETLTLHFDETVESDSLDVTTIRLENTGADNLQEFTLTDLSYTNGPDSPTITINLHTLDLNVIKNLTSLATSEDDVFIFVTDTTIDDMNANLLVPVTMAVRKFTEDQTDPKLVSFEVDLTEETLILTFDETVESESLTIPAITFQSQQTHSDDVTTEYTLTTNSTSGSVDSTILLVDLGVEDLNAIKFIRSLATDPDSTFLRITNLAVDDMNENEVVSITNDLAMEHSGFIDDVTPPTLVTFDIDMDSGEVHLVFDETVMLSTILFTRLEFVAADDVTVLVETAETARHHLLAEFDMAHFDKHIDSTDIFFTLTESDRDELMRKDVCWRDDDCYIRVNAGAVKDMNGNDIEYVPDDEKVHVSKYAADVTRPWLESFEVDMDLMTLTLSFSEPIRTRELDPAEITLQKFCSSDVEYTLTGGTTNELNSRVVVFSFSRKDSNELKKIKNVATGKSDSWIVITDDSVADLATNPNKLMPIVDTFAFKDAMSTKKFTSDSTNPVLESFSLDLTASTLTLFFSETVEVSTLDLTQIYIHGTTESGESVRLVNADGEGMMTRDAPSHPFKTLDMLISGNQDASDTNEPFVVIALGFADLNSLKERENTATSDKDTFISVVETKTVKDMFFSATGGNTNDGSDIVQMIGVHGALLGTNVIGGVFTEDKVEPVLERFSLDLDGDEPMLSLTFSETMLKSTTTVDRIVFHSTADNADGSVEYRLTDSSVLSEYVAGQVEHDPSTNPDGTLLIDENRPHRPNNYIVNVRLGRTDINQINVMEGFCSHTGNTFIAIDSGAVSDMNYQPATAIESTKALGAFAVFADKTKPKLLSFDIDMDLGTLSLRFSESVKVSTLNTNVLTVTNSEPSALVDLYEGHTLTANSATRVVGKSVNSGPSHTTSADGAEITVTLGRNDLNELKRQTGLAINRESSALVFNGPIIWDMHGNPVAVRPEQVPNVPLVATEFTADTTKPTIVAFDLDYDTGLLYLEFDETIDYSSFVGGSRIALHSAVAAGRRSARGTVDGSGSGDVEDTEYEWVWEYEWITNDKSELVNNEFVSKTSVSIPAGTTVLKGDMEGFLQIGSVLTFSKGTPREESRTVAGFGSVILDRALDNDHESGSTIHATVNPEAVDFNAVVAGLENVVVRLTDDSKLVLVDAASSSLPDSPLLAIQLSKTDLWRVKNEAGLLTTSDNGHLTVAGDIAVDMINNNYVPQQNGAIRDILADVTSPILQWYSVDLILGTITMSFDEPVDPATINLAGATFQSTKNIADSASTFGLTAGVAVTKEIGTLMIVDLTDENLGVLQKDMVLLESNDDNFLSFDNTIVDDMSGGVCVGDVVVCSRVNIAPISSASAMQGTDYGYYNYATVDTIGPDAGNPAGGTVVTANGIGFTQESLRGRSRYDGPLPVTVFVNGVPATGVTVNSDTELTFVTPALTNGLLANHELTVIIKIDTALETEYSGFTYLENPVITKIHPIAGAVNGGTKVTMFGRNFGMDTSTGRGSNVRATFGLGEATDCHVENGNAICTTPSAEGDDSDVKFNLDRSIDILLDIDGTPFVFESSFHFLDDPTIASVAPDAGYFQVDTAVEITGTNFGPLSDTKDGPAVRVFVGDRECTGVRVVDNGDAATEAIECTVPAGHGPGVVVIDVDKTVTTEEEVIFTDFNDAGEFAFGQELYQTTESESEVTITVTRTLSDHASPASIIVEAVADSLAYAACGSNPYNGPWNDYYVYQSIEVEFAANEFSKEVVISNAVAASRVQPHPRSGCFDDRAFTIRILEPDSEHGSATAGADAQIEIQSLCDTISGGCQLELSFGPFGGGMTLAFGRTDSLGYSGSYVGNYFGNYLLGCDYPDAFVCGPFGSRECIPGRQICDGDDDCGNGADEQNCPGGARHARAGNSFLVEGGLP